MSTDDCPQSPLNVLAHKEIVAELLVALPVEHFKGSLSLLYFGIGRSLRLRNTRLRSIG